MPVQPNINAFQPPFFFFSNDNNKKIQFVSPSVFDILGFTPNALVGRDYISLLVDGHPLNQKVLEYHHQRFAGDGNQTFQVVVLAADGLARTLQLQTYGECGATGDVITNHGLAQDVTATMQMPENIGKTFHKLIEFESRLTEKEKHVLHLVLIGRLNKSIARELSVSERAIEMARSRLMNKFEAETSAQLIAKAAELRTLKRVFAGQNLVA